MGGRINYYTEKKTSKLGFDIYVAPLALSDTALPTILPAIVLADLRLHIIVENLNTLIHSSAKTDPASDPSALRPDASDASPASHASCAS